MLKLIVDSGENVQSATIPIRWCVDKETLEILKENEIVNPCILLVVVNGSGYEKSRQIAPLEQLIDYIQFQSPGKNKILATIIYDSDGKKENLWEKFVAKENGRYRTDVVYNGSLWNLGNTFESAEINVMVAQELFAKEYPAWEKKWVNLFFEKSELNQCQYRKRRVVAYTIQPPLVLLYMTIKFVIGYSAVIFLLLFGMRNVNFRPLFHLWKDTPNEIWKDVESDNSIFIKNKSGRKRFYLISFFSLFLAVIVIATSSIAIKVIVGGGAVLLFFFWNGNLLDWLDSKEKEREGVKIKEYPKKYETEFQPLLCNGDLSTDIKTLPKEKRTLYLRYKDLKAKVCKPLPR